VVEKKYKEERNDALMYTSEAGSTMGCAVS
jgi:hypothetical protein